MAIYQDPINNFLHGYFESPAKKLIIQVGANDGVMCDPLRPFLLDARNFHAILIEPIPFYANKLRDLYIKNPHVTIMQLGIDSEPSRRKIYFIDPKVADLMNGDGPLNDWAHGQGSFDRETIEYWIDMNAFRGDEYKKNIPYFKSSIESMEISCLPLSGIPIKRRLRVKNFLLCIDAQGFELSVLKGIDWSCGPKYILFEDDLNNGGLVLQYLESKNYHKLCEFDGNKLYGRPPDKSLARRLLEAFSNIRVRKRPSNPT